MCPMGLSIAQVADKPNTVVIMGDDIGWFNPSCYNHGMMGYETPTQQESGSLTPKQ